jgi:hypothetical protein
LGCKINRNGFDLLICVALGELVHDRGSGHATGFVILHFFDHVVLIGSSQRNHARLSSAIGAMAGRARSCQATGLQGIDLGLRQTRHGNQGGR